MIKKTLLALIVAQCSSTVVFGDVLFEEHFTDGLLTKENLNYSYQAESGGALRLRDEIDDGISYTLPDEVANPQKFKTQYFSFLLKSENADNANKFAGVIFYKDGKEVFGLGNDFTSSDFSCWFGDSIGHAVGNGRTPVDQAVHKFVVKIEYHDDGPEKILIGLDPDTRRSFERQPDHIWSEYDAELGFDELRIRCGNADCTWMFDELIFASDFKSVMQRDELPGELVARLDAHQTGAPVSGMISDGIAGFLPAGAKDAELAPSLSLLEPVKLKESITGAITMKPSFSTVDGKKYAYLKVDPETDLYGTGEVTGSLLRNGYKIRMCNFDNPLYGKANQLYQTHPWVIGVRKDGSAFGVLFDCTWVADLDLREGIVYSTSDEAPDFPVIVIEGDSPREIVARLGELTGTMPMPPRWALGYQQCRWSYYPDARAREIADTFRAKQIPCDVIWFDIHYMDEYRIFTFDKNRYPNPKDTNKYLHSLGFKGVWMIDPGVKYEAGYSVYDSGTKQDVWVKNAAGEDFVGGVWPGDCVFPDFTRPETRTWWAGLYKDFMAQGIDGVWNDMNEPSVFGGPGGTMPMDNMHRGGGGLPVGTHEQYHNTFGMLMTKASREGILAANPDKRPFVLTRSNFIGGHRYAATWTGDNNATWQHFKWSVPMSITLGLSGQPFNGPDIGGFGGDATPDLWGHWVALGAFYPFSRAHTSAGTANQEPWEFGQEVEDTARLALQRRYRLMPYLYTAFRNAHTGGVPVMLPVMFADPADESLRMEDRAFMVGSDLAVVPKWAEDVKLPSGIWETASLVGEDSTKDKYQCDVLVRGGAIVPLGPVVQSTAELSDNDVLTLMIVLDENGKAKGSLYEDAGDGYEFEDGRYRESGFVAQRSGNQVIVKCAGQRGKMKLRKRNADVQVMLDGKVYRGEGNIYSKKGIAVSLVP